MNTIYIKLGGSIITEKSKPHTVQFDILRRLSNEIHQARQENPGLSLVIGHGSGSFAHIPAEKYHTIHGVASKDQWKGFVEVWREARELNKIVADALLDAGLPIIAFPPSASVLTENRKIISWDLSPMEHAILNGLIPLINGDVIFDINMGGSILSTEELFSYMAERIKPERILLVGLELGVWKDYPKCTQLLPHITPDSYTESTHLIMGSSETDVTGGMAEKVADMLRLVGKIPGLEVMIFSGKEPGNLFNALSGVSIGTRISQ
jgi:isopentenyl phosphate kinase